MSFGDRIRAANRLQHTRGFKIAATAAFALLALGALVTYFVLVTSGEASGAEQVLERLQLTEEDGNTEIVRSLLGGQGGLGGVAVAVVGGLVIWVGVIWLGAALTYLGLTLVAGLIAGAAFFMGNEVMAVIVAGLAILTQGFVVLLQLLRLLLSGHHPVLAVARNVLAEAVRMKISLVFIVMLIFGLSLLPSLLNDEQPLRFRVQSFLQWSMGGSFWILALLTLLFSISSVAGEQRDRIIWQTITKPVAAWQYILGKWLGVASLSAVLLIVASSGIFMFTEYLRNQPAQGEAMAFVSNEEGRAISEDRLILETRVLTARRTVPFTLPPLLDPESPEFLELMRTRLEAVQAEDPTFGQTQADIDQYISDNLKALERQELVVLPGADYGKQFTFEGLGDARDRNVPINLTYKIEAEGNRPDRTYRISFLFSDGTIIARETGLGYDHTISIAPSAIDNEGNVRVVMFNGEFLQTRGVTYFDSKDQIIFQIPRDGLEVSYAVGGYQLNYLRAMTILWVKLAFIASLGVFMGAFLSFPVATLCGAGVFFLAEMAGFLSDTIDRIGISDARGNIQIHKLITTPLAEGVSIVFSQYANLNPVARLVDGRLLSWGDLAVGLIALGAVCLLFFALSIFVFRRRELALYSGQ